MEQTAKLILVTELLEPNTNLTTERIHKTHNFIHTHYYSFSVIKSSLLLLTSISFQVTTYSFLFKTLRGHNALAVDAGE